MHQKHPALACELSSVALPQIHTRQALNGTLYTLIAASKRFERKVSSVERVCEAKKPRRLVQHLKQGKLLPCENLAKLGISPKIADTQPKPTNDIGINGALHQTIHELEVGSGHLLHSSELLEQRPVFDR